MTDDMTEFQDAAAKLAERVSKLTGQGFSAYVFYPKGTPDERGKCDNESTVEQPANREHVPDSFEG